ncbi:hypothetical protein DMA12_30135 [Amycolatopsis balhimycina DSM 5908]|uniref:Uncharacterized protein n=2 Tax=Amycolatopsis balhimycina TaxID=208443 RepID=A0A428W8B2_AMYBA|nr:hypothetical protein DMA12_30135 [Amycolatopsis balhimycina DSM 5908]
MVSKTRVVLIMLLLLAVAIGVIVVLAKAGAGAFWVQTAAIAVLLIGGLGAQSMGLFQKKAKKKTE